MYQLKVGEGSLSLVSLGKNLTMTFQHFVIQVCKNTRFLHLSLAVLLAKKQERFQLLSGGYLFRKAKQSRAG